MAGVSAAAAAGVQRASVPAREQRRVIEPGEVGGFGGCGSWALPSAVRGCGCAQRARGRLAASVALVATLLGMAVNNGGNPATHFGRQMRKERLARGWSLREFSARTGINIGHASRIENGKRPPTENVAAACDAAFPERKGWFTEYYEELSTWSEVPAAFRDWTEHEDQAATLRVWSPGIVHGLLQTEDYARALLSTYPGVTGEAVGARLAARMERQRRLSRAGRAVVVHRRRAVPVPAGGPARDHDSPDAAHAGRRGHAERHAPGAARRRPPRHRQRNHHR